MLKTLVLSKKPYIWWRQMYIFPHQMYIFWHRGDIWSQRMCIGFRQRYIWSHPRCIRSFQMYISCDQRGIRLHQGDIFSRQRCSRSHRWNSAHMKWIRIRRAACIVPIDRPFREGKRAWSWGERKCSAPNFLLPEPNRLHRADASDDERG